MSKIKAFSVKILHHGFFVSITFFGTNIAEALRNVAREGYSMDHVASIAEQTGKEFE